MLNYVMLTKNTYTTKTLPLSYSPVIREENPSFVLVPCHDIIEPDSVISCKFYVTVGGQNKTFEQMTEEDVNGLLGIEEVEDDEADENINASGNMVSFSDMSFGGMSMVFRIRLNDITVTKERMYEEINEKSINSFVLCEIHEKNGEKRFVPLAVASRKVTANIVKDVEQFNDADYPTVTMSFGEIFPLLSIRHENGMYHVNFNLNACATMDMFYALKQRVEQLEERISNIRTRTRHQTT